MLEKRNTIAHFGEAAKGDFRTAYICNNVVQLSETFGEPPAHSQGIVLAVQSLLFQQEVIFFRVHEEGFSLQDYLLGLKFLENKELFPSLSAICLPGVGSRDILDATTPLCQERRSILLFTSADLYDLLTNQ